MNCLDCGGIVGIVLTVQTALVIVDSVEIDPRAKAARTDTSTPNDEAEEYSCGTDRDDNEKRSTITERSSRLCVDSLMTSR